MLQIVTVTGADDSVNPRDLLKLAEEFPFVEFGILMSPKHEGEPRFPSLEWQEQLCSEMHYAVGVPVRLSAHLCGGYVRDVLVHESFNHGGLLPRLQLGYNRVQLNTHGEAHDQSKTNGAFCISLQHLTMKAHQVIFQMDGINEYFFKKAPLALPPARRAALFDLSGGAGILPKEWPSPIPQTFCGYAGGLSPDNVSQELVKISTKCQGIPYWIDAESLLRSDYTDSRDRFDLEKVYLFLKAAEPFTQKEVYVGMDWAAGEGPKEGTT